MNLEEGQWQIGSYIMGPRTDTRVLSIDPGTWDTNSNDFGVERSDELRFARDTLKPSEITFQVGIMDNRLLFTEYADARIPGRLRGNELLEQLTNEWRADFQRKIWNAQKPLYFCRYGIQKVLYGRPRKFTPSNHFPKAEFLPVQMSFQPGDTFCYSADEFGWTIAPGGSNNIVRPSPLDGGGPAPSWIRFVIQGPIINPVITVGSLFTIQLSTTIAAGVTVEINSFPWLRRVVDSNSNTLSAMLTGDSVYLDQMSIPANSTTPVSFTGTGTNVNTKLTCLWREAYYTI